MKSTPIILALSLLLTACSRHEAKLDQQIAGTWTGEAEAGTMTFAPDGGFSVVRKSDTNIMAGTWQITDRDLVLTLTNAPLMHGRSVVGSVSHNRIVSMDAHQFVFNTGGRT